VDVSFDFFVGFSKIKTSSRALFGAQIAKKYRFLWIRVWTSFWI
jgi:hypothetical protein